MVDWGRGEGQANNEAARIFDAEHGHARVSLPIAKEDSARRVVLKPEQTSPT